MSLSATPVLGDWAESECGRTVVADFLVRPDGYETTCVDAMEIPQFVH